MWVQLQLHYKILIFNSNKSSEGEILFTVPQYTPLTENRYYISLYVIFSKYTVRGQMDELNDTQWGRIKKYAHYRRLRIGPWSQRGCNKDVRLIKLTEGKKWGKRNGAFREKKTVIKIKKWKSNKKRDKLH